tara:strand:+ start:161 stop:337 length:177 start_codon:yes stop_codon:yes gene_type:complete
MEITEAMKAQAAEAMQAAQAVVEAVKNTGATYDLAIEARNAATDVFLAVCGYEFREVA